MSKAQKLINRLKSRPKDFTWQEADSLLQNFGFTQVQGKGSRVKYLHQQLDIAIHMHRPHPGNILKQYVIRELIALLAEKNLI